MEYKHEFINHPNVVHMNGRRISYCPLEITTVVFNWNNQWQSQNNYTQDRQKITSHMITETFMPSQGVSENNKNINVLLIVLSFCADGCKEHHKVNPKHAASSQYVTIFM